MGVGTLTTAIAPAIGPHLWRHYDFTFYMESYLPVSCARF